MYTLGIACLVFSLFWTVKYRTNRVGLMAFFMGIGMTSSALPFWGRWEDVRTSICFTQGGYFLTLVGMQFYTNSMGHISISAKVWTPMGMATILASVNACLWAVIILVSVESSLAGFFEIATWDLIYLWVVIWCAIAQVKTNEPINFWVLLFGRIGSWFLLIGLPVNVGVAGYT